LELLRAAENRPSTGLIAQKDPCQSSGNLAGNLEAEGQPLFLIEVCAQVGVNERTLRNYCLEYLGMSPHRYLWRRRMNQVRHAVSLADPVEATVTTIATNYGFWELGRFSVAYRKLFGESPSTTLRKSPEHVQFAARSGAR